MPPNNTRAFSNNDDCNSSDCISNDAWKEDPEKDEKSTDMSETTAFGDSSSDGDDSSSHHNNHSNNIKSNNKNNNSKLLLAASTAALLYATEKRRQIKLTQPPLVMQVARDSRMASISKKLLQDNEILSRPIVPAMLIGTNGQLASAAAYMSRGPSSNNQVHRFQESLVSSLDGAEIVLEWELPRTTTTATSTHSLSIISHPTVFILHGINNSSSFGYVKSLQRTMTNRGWNAVAMNFRGCAAGTTMKTPRSYTAAYTGDLRSAVRQLVGRMQNTTVPLVLVGNSLGANLVTKYLGEEGLAGTLPPNVVAGISLGNPFSFRSNYIGFPFGQVMGSARKLNYYQQRQAMSMNWKQTNLHPFRVHLASLDEALAPTKIRTEPHPPFATKIGYGHAKIDNNLDKDNPLSAAQDYWADSSCYKQGRHVSVPLLHVVAQDDNLCHWSSQRYLSYSLQNPNVMVVETKTGGHLGWWHQTKNGVESWADEATADFIQAVLDTRGESPAIVADSMDDAHILYAKLRLDNRTLAESSDSMRTIPTDRGDNSTIATNDLSNHHGENISTTTSTVSSPSQTYFHFQEVLLLQQHQTEQIHETNRLIEKHESIEFSRMHHSRL